MEYDKIKQSVEANAPGMAKPFLKVVFLLTDHFDERLTCLEEQRKAGAKQAAELLGSLGAGGLGGIGSAMAGGLGGPKGGENGS